jgi:alpha-mannosidase
MRRCLIAIAACGMLADGLPARAGDGPAPKKDTFWVVPHTHWEGAVFKTREEYLEMGLPNILKAMRLLREQPTFKFTLDQVAYVRPFLERYPSEVADFRRFLSEGRIQLAGALDVMPDVNMPGGETFVRQIQYGKGYYREKLGVDVTASWLIDTFGHHAQMPQLMKLAGYKSYWFVRGVPKQEHPAEFWWEGIDGTRIPAYYLPFSYAVMWGSPDDQAKFFTFAKAHFDMLSPNVHGPNRVAVCGPDVSEPESHLAPRIEEFSHDPKAPFHLKMAVPADYEAAVPPRSDWPVFKGELNPIFQGTYSSRIELKNWMRLDERQILTAEKLSAIASTLGTPPDLDGIMSAWEPVLFNETHDLASGVMTDHVYDDTIAGYQYAEKRANEIIASRWNVLESQIDTTGPGEPLVVFNSLGWPRNDIVEVEAGFGLGGVYSPTIVASDGQSLPTQVVTETRYTDGSLKSARLAFIAHNVPAMGYRTYFLRGGKGKPKQTPAETATSGGDTVGLENQLYRIQINKSTGAISSLFVKDGGWEVFAGPANLVVREQDRGDLWELYKGLDGASRVAMTTQRIVPKPGEAAFSSQGKSDPGHVTRGPVFDEFTIARPFDSGKFATMVRVYQGLRRIDITTKLENREKYVRYQVLFPTTIKGGKNVQEIPFGAIERPNAIEFPAQNWVDHGDAKHGLAILNIGLPGNVTTGGTMMVSLLRSHNLGAYGFGGGYEPGMSSETAFEIGRERTMKYALVPHNGIWQESGVYRDGLELNNPLIGFPASAHKGPLPASWGLLDISSPNVVVSSLKPTKSGEIALRVYEATGRTDTRVVLKFRKQVTSAHESNLLEDPGRELTVKDESISFDLRPFEIKTICLRVKGSS